ncbi:MAG TPA: hypothetical protein EYN66_24885, partial [Myxococcales bacterium]|nr:hypothetical protein [Myxococcales bacterium]
MALFPKTAVLAVLLLLLSASTAYGACGDNTCDADETCLDCPADCPDCCGDGECSYLTESCRDCDVDCGTCQGLAGKSCKATNMCGQSAQDCYCDYLCFQKGDCCLDICLHCAKICVTYNFTCGDGVCGVDETCESCPTDCPCPTCGDDKCDYVAGEDCANCSVDCGDCCGNGVCEPEYGEICGMCKNDCACPSCGNGVCEPTLGEDNLSCPPDCPVVCGDKKCNLLYESCSTCPGDCDPCAGTVKVNIITNLPSCEGLCGKNNAECWCDTNCHLYGDCCPDICDHCKMMPNCNSQCGDGICSADEDCTSCDPANPECKWCPVCGDGVCHPAESCQDCSGDCGNCCGNGACEAELGENNTTCSVDCPVINGCGDGVCTPPETCSGCPQDCFCCGNGNCESLLGEGCKTCPQDCGQCAICGNGTCEDPLGENCYNCPEDCKSCTCVFKPDTVDVPSIDGVNLLGGQAVFEHTIVFPPEACDQDSGVTMGSFLQQFFENVP